METRLKEKYTQKRANLEKDQIEPVEMKKQCH